MLIKIKDYFKQLQLLHGALTFGVLVILIVFQYVLPKQEHLVNQQAVYFGVGIAVVCVIVSRIVFVNITTKNRVKEQMKEKLDAYRSAFVIQIGILEGGAIFNAILLYLFGSEINFAMSLALVFLMITRRPTKKDVYRTMYPDNVQNTALDKDDKIII
ncbi:MAG TPA: hypothetical protein PLC61_07710 [Chitinophagales bacterium]|nr:hypothetical protein [Chitinophagales bacterium]HMU97419.1 hypothetical protein [Chitinophagales bacterium]HMV01991.1 hypothetical protein [Chitinophagales bacterium]HMW93365.1 hypothetical protein [Chitinophagales bacterium]HMY41691.1 hypothetical protein [Chitinophagales bacterium]